ncbi:FecR domain-containing protein [Aromatoleum petrolei]|nr:FecR domain-containing protein [Aromatoleum petrolei]
MRSLPPGWRASGARWLQALAVAAGCAAGPAAADCEVVAGRLMSAQAAVERRAAGEAGWQPIAPPHDLCEGDIVTVRAPGRAAIVLADGTLVRLDQNTTLHLLQAGTGRDTELGLVAGFLHVVTRLRKRFGVSTPFVNALVEGTEFTVASTPARAEVVVASGVVRTRNASGEAALQAGEAIEAGPAAPPRAIAVRPLDAMRWAIHYPQIVWHGEAVLAGLAPSPREAVARAQQLMGEARHGEALAALPPAAATDALPVDTLRAALLLALGRVDEAGALVERLGGAAADVAALDALIRVARNERAAALAAAQRARAADAASPAAALALSYAWQAHGDMDAALEAARRASELGPDNPFAWARRAEVELSLARIDAGRASAWQALARAPGLPRARALLGFAQLLAGATATARAEFAAAIEADSADPLAWFGSGLARVRAGEPAAGRRDIEIAVLLDPGNAELRSYLGRVQLEEDRAGLAGKEFEVARRLDPASPTPWHFDAFRLLRDNDPLGALAAGRRALELNDNRVVLRSPLLLDIDRAARSASLGAAYAAVGFDESLRSAALVALDDDPAGPAGHRLLADAHAERPRFESARVSELLQTQLRLPLGQLPVAPQFFAAELPIVDAPRALAPEEAAALFERGPLQFAATLLAGTRATRGGSVLGSVSAERAQVSLGHFDYRREALGAGRDIALTGTRLGLQLVATPATMLLAELETGERRGGEVVEQLLAGVGALPTRLDHRVTRDGARVSLHHQPAVERELIVTAAAQQVGERSLDRLEGAAMLPFERADFDLRTRLDSEELGVLYGVRGTRLGLVVGADAYRERRRTRQDASLCCLFGPDPLTVPLAPAKRETVGYDALFAYLDLRLRPWLRLHVGVAHDALDAERPTSVERTSGKLGASFLVTPSTTLRAAAFDGVKGPKYHDRTLAPTQFAGFNQVFDDLDGTRWRRRAIALDHRFADGGGTGLEWSRRTLAVPGLGCGAADCRADWDERLHRAWVEWPLGRRAAVAAAWHFERLRLDDDPANAPSLPARVRTELVPLSLWLRPAPRLAVQFEAVRVRQRAAIADGAGGLASRSEAAWLGNVRLAWLRADRRAVLSLAAHNLFDRDLAFQNTDFSGNPRVPLFYPERTVLLQASLRF